MVNIEKELQEHIFNYGESKNVSIDIRFACFGDRNRFYTYSKEFSLDCVGYYTEDLEDIKRFFTTYLDVMLEKCEAPMNRIALYVKDIVDMDGWYEVVVGGGLFEDDTMS